MKTIKFIEEPQLFSDKDLYIVHFEEMTNKNELFNQYNQKLRFPYFGFNWDALLDCLRDLDWIEEQGIILVHDDLSFLTKKEIQIYIEILIDAINGWEHSGFHYIEVIFSKKDIDIIKPFMNMVRI